MECLMQKDTFKMVILGKIMVSQRLEVDVEKKWLLC